MKLSNLTAGNHFNATEINKNMGEKLVMHALMTYWDWDVEYVDYTGADLIAIDTNSKNKQKYAISVKTRDLTHESQSISSFKRSDFTYLCEFASDMSKSEEAPMIPLVAFVALTKSGHLYVIIINAYDFDEMCSEGSLVQLSKDGESYSFNIGTEPAEDGPMRIEQVLSDSRVSYIDMEIKDIQKRNFSRKGERVYDSLREENWRNELGDFGEKLTVFLSNVKNRRAFHVKSVGADIIMMDRNDKESQYAVSVKTFCSTESGKYTFTANDICNLTKFSEKWNMKAEVALVSMITDNSDSNVIEKLYYFLIPLQYMEQYIETHLFQGFIFPSGNAYCISWEDHLEDIKNDPNIDFIEIKF